jgi:lipocalin
MDTLQKYLGSWVSILRVIGSLNDGTDSDNANYIMVHDPMLTQIHTIRSRFLC